MLQAGLFADFKGADTLLLWGDAIGVADLRIAMAALLRGDGSRIPITSELSISACDVHEHASRLAIRNGRSIPSMAAIAP